MNPLINLCNVLCLVAFSGFCTVQCRENDVVFNPDTPPDENLFFPDDMPEACKDKNYCFEKGDYYPSAKIDELLREMDVIKTVTEITDRDSLSCQSEECKTACTDDPIYYIRDEDDNVRVVIQSKDKLRQNVNLKWCLQEGRITQATDIILNPQNEPFNHLACKTKYLNFTFTVLNDDLTTSRVAVKGGIPVCCSCFFDTI